MERKFSIKSSLNLSAAAVSFIRANCCEGYSGMLLNTDRDGREDSNTSSDTVQFLDVNYKKNTCIFLLKMHLHFCKTLIYVAKMKDLQGSTLLNVLKNTI